MTRSDSNAIQKRPTQTLEGFASIFSVLLTLRKIPFPLYRLSIIKLETIRYFYEKYSHITSLSIRQRDTCTRHSDVIVARQ